MPVDPQFDDLLALFRAMPAISEMPLEAVRDGVLPTGEPPTPVEQVVDLTVPGPGGDLVLRVYRPSKDTGLPLLLFMHGGGFVVGGLESHDEAARKLTMGTRCITVAVAYRLAPEHPFPAAPEDCYAALTWVARHASELGADGDRIAVLGDSAGGNLAAVMALRARDEGGPPLRGQVLIYPAVDLVATQSLQAAPDGQFHVVSAEDGRYFNRCYLGDGTQARHPHASPMFAEKLEGLPPALVIVAEYDPLCRQGEAYAERLRQAGIDTVLERYEGAIHGFATFPVPMGSEALAQTAGWLRQRFA